MISKKQYLRGFQRNDDGANGELENENIAISSINVPSLPIIKYPEIQESPDIELLDIIENKYTISRIVKLILSKILIPLILFILFWSVGLFIDTVKDVAKEKLSPTVSHAIDAAYIYAKTIWENFSANNHRNNSGKKS